MSQTAPQRHPAVLGGIVLALTLLLGAAAYGLNAVTNPQSSTAQSSVCAPAPNGHPKANPVRSYSQPPTLTLDPAKSYRAVMCTAHGLIVINMRTTTAPLTAGNFIYLANAGFYDGLIFHRVCPNPADSTCGGATFGIDQGGDPLGTGQGGPGYSLKDEGPKGPYSAGTVAMARSSAVSGSQFFINTTDNNGLASQPSVFNIVGDIASGLDVAQKLQKGDKMYWVAVQVAAAGTPSPAASAGASPATTPQASPAASPSAAAPSPSPS